jgi:Gas vesicle synthesis protein GvpL/GvpF
VAKPQKRSTRRKPAKRDTRVRAIAPARITRDAPAGKSGQRPRPGNGAGATESRGKYVYCVVQTQEPLRFGRIGIGAEPAEVTTVNYKDIAAVASDTPTEALDATRENVLGHERVNETVMRHFTVIPMSFGTVFKTRDDIVELLRGAYDAFHDVLQKMQDKLEFGLKVLWDRDAVIKEIEQEDEDIRRLKLEISSQKGSTYFARMQYGRLVDAALQSRSERYVAEIFEQLREVAVASRANKPIGDKMIMNAAFLVPRDKENDFDARVKAVGARYRQLNFKYTGPWPPYNFVNIRLKLERAR